MAVMVWTAEFKLQGIVQSHSIFRDPYVHFTFVQCAFTKFDKNFNT